LVIDALLRQMKKFDKDSLKRNLDLVEVNTIENEDMAYWLFHRTRYQKTVHSILKEFEGLDFSKIRILDIGSHYLHLPIILKKYDCDLCGLDINTFTDLNLVKRRAKEENIDNQTIYSGLESGKFPFEENEKFDLILFTETLEHLSFQPNKMWEGIFKLLKKDGKVYITTPNSLSLRRIAYQLFRILKFEGYGPTLEDLLLKPSYALHWKEYSPQEIRKYFRILGHKVRLCINYYRYKKLLRSFSLLNIIGLFFNLISMSIKPFREELEIWVTLQDQ